MEGRRFRGRTPGGSDWRERRRKAHEATRNWRGLERQHASLLWADKQLDSLCTGTALPLPVPPRARGITLRALQRLIDLEQIDHEDTVQDIAALFAQDSREREPSVEFLPSHFEAKAREWWHQGGEYRASLLKWCQKLRITSRPGEQPGVGLEQLLVKIAEVSLRYYGIKGLDRLSVRCAISELANRIADTGASRSTRQEARSQMFGLLQWAIPTYRNQRVVDPDDIREQHGRYKDAAKQAQKGVRNRELRLARIKQKLPEIAPDVWIEAEPYLGHPSRLADALIAFQQRPPVQARTVTQWRKQKGLIGCPIPLAVAYTLNKS